MKKNKKYFIKTLDKGTARRLNRCKIYGDYGSHRKAVYMTTLSFKALTEKRNISVTVFGMDCDFSIDSGQQLLILGEEESGYVHVEISEADEPYGIALKDYMEEVTREYPTEIISDDLEELTQIADSAPDVTEEVTPIFERVPEVVIPEPTPYTLDLFSILAELRRDIAKEQGVPPYIIFHDKALHEMARTLPQDLNAFSKISGVGKAKLDRYGNRFIDAIREAVA
jgi:superfamily II DNA helicase RecQ